MDDSVNKGQVLHFKTAQEAQQYAKNNIGVTITRSPNGNGYITKTPIEKVNNNLSDIKEMLINNPEVPIMATSEVASTIGEEEIVNSEVNDTIAEEVLLETFSPVSKTGLALGGLGLIFGLPF